MASFIQLYAGKMAGNDYMQSDRWNDCKIIAQKQLEKRLEIFEHMCLKGEISEQKYIQIADQIKNNFNNDDTTVHAIFVQSILFDNYQIIVD